MCVFMQPLMLLQDWVRKMEMTESMVRDDAEELGDDPKEFLFPCAQGPIVENRSSRKIDSRRLFSREYDFPKTLSLTENQFSGKTYLYTIGSRTTTHSATPSGRTPSPA